MEDLVSLVGGWYGFGVVNWQRPITKRDYGSALNFKRLYQGPSSQVEPLAGAFVLVLCYGALTGSAGSSRSIVGPLGGDRAGADCASSEGFKYRP